MFDFTLLYSTSFLSFLFFSFLFLFCSVLSGPGAKRAAAGRSAGEGWMVTYGGVGDAIVVQGLLHQAQQAAPGAEHHRLGRRVSLLHGCKLQQQCRHLGQQINITMGFPLLLCFVVFLSVFYTQSICCTEIDDSLCPDQVLVTSRSRRLSL